jgi:hypothetical protein
MPPCYQESEKFLTQEPKPEAIFLVGSCLRLYDFGFVHTFQRLEDNRQCGQSLVRTIVSADNCQVDICQGGHLSKNKYFKTYHVWYSWKCLDFLIVNQPFWWFIKLKLKEKG